MWFIYTMEYYSPTPRNEGVPSAATGMDLEVPTLSEGSQIKTGIISLTCGI